MQAASVLSAQEVSKRFGHRTVLRDVSFSIQEGETVLLLGNNGAGKSTLLHLLTALTPPSGGELRFRDTPYSRSAWQLRRTLGSISHNSRFYGDLGAAENLRLFGVLYGVGGLRDKIGHALHAVGLTAYAELPVRTFSSGMVKRLAMARLMLYEPQVLLLDEPYSGLDRASVAMLDEFLERFRDGGGTTILVTHQFTRGVTVCNRIVILHGGTVVYNEPQQEVSAEHCYHLLQTHARSTGGVEVEGAAARTGRCGNAPIRNV